MKHALRLLALIATQAQAQIICTDVIPAGADPAKTAQVLRSVAFEL